MKLSKLINSLLLIIFIVFITSLILKKNMKPEDFKGTEPTIKIEEYFNGQVKAWGLLQNRSGKVTRQFKADMFGKFENNILILEEDFFWTDGEKQKRTWKIEKLDENNYQKGIKVTDEELSEVNLVGDDFHPEWNYTVMHN